MFVSTIVAITLLNGLLCLSAEETETTAAGTEQKGTLHKTLSKINSSVDKIPKRIKSMNNQIEVSVENMKHPEPEEYGMIRSSIRGGAQLTGAIGREVGQFGVKVASAATELGKSSVKALKNTLKRSLRRLTGGKPASSSNSTSDSTQSNSGEQPTVINQTSDSPDATINITV